MLDSRVADLEQLRAIDQVAAVSVPPVDRRALAPPVVLFGALVAFAGGYGFHRDELYSMANARQLAWGYVDHPPMTPMLGWLSQLLFGDSLRGLRVLPALVAALIVVAAVLVCRELGGDSGAQRLTSVVVSTTSLVLVLGHMLTTPTLDVLWWTQGVWLLIRIVRTRDSRWWLLLGVVLGLGVLNKYTVLVAVASYAIALMTQPERRVLWNWWVVIGVAVTFALWALNLWWQARNGWPVFEFTAAIANESNTNRLVMVPFQVLLLGPLVFAVGIDGWRQLVSDQRWRPYRFVIVGPLICIMLLLVTGDKPYYSAGALPAVLAAGSIVVSTRLESRSHARLGWWLTANLAVAALVALPILPVSVVGGTPVVAVNPDVRETIGWPEFVDQVALVANTIPADERPGPVILTSNYGQAAALERWGPSLRMPMVYSAHNSYADFGIPPASTGPVLIVGYSNPGELFLGCTRKATIRSRFDLDNEENGQAVWLCDASSTPWTSG